MADFAMVTARLATGASIASVADAQQLISAGVTHILDLTSAEDDQSFLAGLQVAYLYNPTADDGAQKPDSWWDASLAFASQSWTVPGSCLYCHCSAGVNRGPSTAYAVLRAICGLSGLQADTIIRAVRPQALMRYADQFDAYWMRKNPGKAVGPAL